MGPWLAALLLALAPALEAAAAPFAVVVLPDTQNMVADHPEVWAAMIDWIIASREALDIRFVVHEGDITDANSTAEWQTVYAKMVELELAGIPYSLLPGNHDLGVGGSAADRWAEPLNAFFPVARLATLPGWGGSFAPDGSENTYHHFAGGAGEWLVVSLEFGPRQEVIAWADAVLAAHPGHHAILVTHTYLYNDDLHHSLEAYGHDWSPHAYGLAAEPGGAADGLELWDALVRRHANLVMVLAGHVPHTGYVASRGDHGNDVHQLLANYQTLPEGGGGWLRLLTIDPEAEEVTVTTYSPWLDRFKNDPENAFSFSYAEAGSAGEPIFADGFESGDLAAWSRVSP